MAHFIPSSCTCIIVCAVIFCSVLTITLGVEDECVFPTDTIPYVTFMGVRLPNHSFVDLEQLGNAQNGSDVLQCHTNVPTCCEARPEGNRGQWIFPNGQVVQSSGSEYSIRRLNQQIDLAYNGGVSGDPTIGMFRCDVPTTSANRSSFYVGIYDHNGKLTCKN